MLVSDWISTSIIVLVVELNCKKREKDLLLKILLDVAPFFFSFSFGHMGGIRPLNRT